jgi:hypothetical protein
MDLARYSKAIAAAVMAAIGLANAFFNQNWVVDPEAVNAAVALLTPVLVYLIPNKA